MTDIQKSKIQEIVTLHNEIAGHLRISLHKAIRIGELLTEQKASLEHGEWLPWIKANLPFSDRTARVYVRCFENKDKLADSATLASAIKLLAGPEVYLTDACKDCKHWYGEFSNNYLHDMPEKCRKAWQTIKAHNLPYRRDRYKGNPSGKKGDNNVCFSCVDLRNTNKPIVCPKTDKQTHFMGKSKEAHERTMKILPQQERGKQGISDKGILRAV